jgi:uracil-DNA glycosylase
VSLTTASSQASGKAYRSLASLQRDNRRCRRCVEAGFPLESWPVVEGRAGQRAYLLGQAPGIVEGMERRPWRGRAGATLRRWLQLEEDAFYETFYCAAVTRCYPGHAPSGRGDRPPTPRERKLCASWREHELRLLQPDLIVTVGVAALRALLGVSALTAAIGKSYELGAAIVVPLPHPSGASGWLNDTTNRARLGKAITHVRRELARLEEAAGAEGR